MVLDTKLQGIVEQEGNMLRWGDSVKEVCLEEDGLVYVVLKDGSLFDGFCRGFPENGLIVYDKPIRSEADMEEAYCCRKHLTWIAERIALQKMCGLSLL